MTIIYQGCHRTTAILKGVAVQEKKWTQSDNITQDLKSVLSKHAHFSLTRHKELSEKIRTSQERRPNASELLSGVHFTPLSAGRVLFSAVLKKHRCLVIEELQVRGIQFEAEENITALKLRLKQHECDEKGKSFKPISRTSAEWDIPDQVSETVRRA